jgi:hypothetical protein
MKDLGFEIAIFHFRQSVGADFKVLAPHLSTAKEQHQICSGHCHSSSDAHAGNQDPRLA